MGIIVNTRELVLDMLLEMEQQNTFSHMMLKQTLDKYDYLEVRDKRFIKRLFEGIIERTIELDYWIGQFAKIKGKMKPTIRWILRLSIYQILYMDSVPDSAACNEAVKLTKKKKYHQLNGFVNGVLRNFSRQKETLQYPDQKKTPKLWMSVFYSMPEWIVEKWIGDFGIEETEKILADLMKEHAVTIRMSELLTEDEKQKVIKEWEEKEIAWEMHPYLSYAYRLQNVDGMHNLTCFQKGYYTVQDVSSMLVAEVANIRKDMSIIDVCAAPGGKSLHMATKLAGTGHVEARDVTDYKVSLIEENIARLQLKNIDAKVMDATVLDESCIGAADLVLADVPCSGLGVMGKKRDIKYRVTMEEVKEIVALQKQIISTVKQYVKEGGTLLYSTCTITKEENKEMVDWILQQGDFALESIDSYLPKCLQGNTTKQGYLQLIPGVHDCDGFFIARFVRVKKDA